MLLARVLLPLYHYLSTGAGKSSLLTAILRLVEIERGTVRVDGVDLASIGLNALRSRIAVIPQDPVLFSGTVRSNLDPFKKYTGTEWGWV